MTSNSCARRVYRNDGFGVTLSRSPSHQPRLLRHDNVVTEGALNLADLGIAATAAEVILPSYLDRHRPAGRFDQSQPA